MTLKKTMLKTEEDFNQYEYLNTPINITKSGYTRYGAAMYFFNKGFISETTLGEANFLQDRKSVV